MNVLNTSEPAQIETANPSSVSQRMGAVVGSPFVAAAFASIAYRMMILTNGSTMLVAPLLILTAICASAAIKGENLATKILGGFTGVGLALGLYAGAYDLPLANTGMAAGGCEDAIMETIGLDQYPNSRGTCAITIDGYGQIHRALKH